MQFKVTFVERLRSNPYNALAILLLQEEYCMKLKESRALHCNQETAFVTIRLAVSSSGNQHFKASELHHTAVRLRKNAL